MHLLRARRHFLYKFAEIAGVMERRQFDDVANPRAEFLGLLLAIERKFLANVVRQAEQALLEMQHRSANEEVREIAVAPAHQEARTLQGFREDPPLVVSIQQQKQQSFPGGRCHPGRAVRQQFDH
jgi:hypothetical protein